MMKLTEHQRLLGYKSDKSPADSRREARAFAKEICKKWVPVLGLQGWTFGVYIAWLGEMDDTDALGLSNIHNHAKWAEIQLRHPREWRNDGPNRNLGFEAVVIHELLHIFIADCRLNLNEDDEETLVYRLTDCFTRAGVDV